MVGDRYNGDLLPGVAFWLLNAEARKTRRSRHGSSLYSGSMHTLPKLHQRSPRFPRLRVIKLNNPNARGSGW